MASILVFGVVGEFFFVSGPQTVLTFETNKI